MLVTLLRFNLHNDLSSVYFVVLLHFNRARCGYSVTKSCCMFYMSDKIRAWSGYSEPIVRQRTCERRWKKADGFAHVFEKYLTLEVVVFFLSRAEEVCGGGGGGRKGA